MTKFSQQVDRYLRYCEFEENMTAQTMKSKRYILKAFCLAINRKDACKVTDDDYSNWRQSLAKQGVSPRTVNTRIAHTVAFFKYLQARGETLKIHVDLIKPSKVEDSDIQFFTRDQIESVKENCRGLRDYLFISLAFESGLRIHELAKLELEHISDLHIKVLGKGGHLRDTFILPKTREVLDKWLALNDISTGYVFPSPIDFESHLSIDTIRVVMKDAFKRAGIEDFNPHDLRHSFATHLAIAEAPLIELQRLLGHKDPKTTSRYIHLLVDQLQQSHQKYFTKMETEAS